MTTRSPSAAAPAVTYAPPGRTPPGYGAAGYGQSGYGQSGARPLPAGGAAAGGAGVPAPGPAAGASAPGPVAPPAPALFDTLLDALRTERKLVDDLAATMRRQRDAVAGDDLETVDDTVFATHRVLATLGQARLRRRQLNRLFAGADEVPVRALADAACALAGAGVPPAVADAVRGASDELVAGASALAREVDVNRRVLRDALAHGDRHARALGGLGALPGADGAPGVAGGGAPGAAGVDRTA